MRIYLSPELIKQTTSILLPPDKSRHLITVMRCKAGDEITVIDGLGRSYRAAISSIQKKDVLVDIISETGADMESPVDLILCQGILKGEKMDLVIQKATELGTNKIFPVISERCQVRETRKTTRWRKIAEEAAEQCGRAVVPEIRGPLDFAALLDAAKMKSAKGLIFWEKGGIPPDEAIAGAAFNPGKDPLFLLIGPEGGFAPAEVDMAESNGFIRSTLGRRILRAETAAIAAIAIVQFLAEKSGTGR